MRSLSEAMSTAIELVSEVIVARMRLAWTPWPSWTSECLLSRIQGMSRETASSMIAWVDGPNAVRWARRMKASSSSLEVEVGVGLDEVVDQAYGEPAGLEPDLLVDVAVDDVVAALLALDLAGLAAPDVVADDLLQRQRHVLGDVAEPGALVEPLHEAASTTAGAGVLAQAGQRLEQVVGEAGEGVGGVLLEHAEVDDEVDRLLVGPDVGAAVDAGLDDGQIGGRATAELSADARSLVSSSLALSVTGRLLCFVGRCGGAAPRVRCPRRRCLGPSCADHGWPRPIRRPRPGRRAAWPAGAVRVVRSNSAPGRQHVQHHARGEDRAALAGLVGVGHHVRAVDQRHRAAPDDAQHVAVLGAADHGGGVLVDAHARAAAGSARRSSAAGRSGCAGRSAGRSRSSRPARARRPPGSSAAWAWTRPARTRPCARTGCWPRPRCRRWSRRARAPRRWPARTACRRSRWTASAGCRRS